MKNLSESGCRKRRERLIAKAGVDLIVIADPPHIQYLTGLYISPLGLGGRGSNYLLIDTASGKTTLILHSFVKRGEGAIHVDDLVVWDAYSLEVPGAAPRFARGLEILNENLGGRRFKSAGYEAGLLPLGTRIGDGVDLTPLLLELRRKKDEDELELIRAAIGAILAGHKAARATIRPGLTELEIYNAVMSAIVKEAGDGVLPMGDFASGERAFEGGGPPTSRILRPGELMILDIFPLVNGYKGDFTATLAVNGKPTNAQKKLEAALVAALEAGEAILRPGTAARDVYRSVYSELEKRGFSEGFPHHAGHGLGLDHPEAPFFLPRSGETIQAGDVVTLEPGAYSRAKQYGARIERNYLITDHGCSTLTPHSISFA
ncbi:MAG TPA: Xaa-Pro peptidase family protein [Spirochaetia bacterium]|nr:Xaa-Pro peptidase family protein [Spirochaetia bacterium]